MPGKQGQFDRIYEKPDGTLVFVECKGGGSTLGGRVDKNDVKNQQGTKAYMEDIAENMIEKLEASGDLDLETLAEKIEAAINAINPPMIEYHLVKQGLGEIGNSSILKVKNFNVN